MIGHSHSGLIMYILYFAYLNDRIITLLHLNEIKWSKDIGATKKGH